MIRFLYNNNNLIMKKFVSVKVSVSSNIFQIVMLMKMAILKKAIGAYGDTNLGGTLSIRNGDTNGH